MKKMPNQRHISEFAELDGRWGYSGIFFYEDANQTEIFTGMKSEMTYITGVKNIINPNLFVSCNNVSKSHFNVIPNSAL